MDWHQDIVDFGCSQRNDSLFDSIGVRRSMEDANRQAINARRKENNDLSFIGLEDSQASLHWRSTLNDTQVKRNYERTPKSEGWSRTEIEYVWIEAHRLRVSCSTVS